ncbi:MAG TPA: hypothetical protein VH374_20490 [Polyangia bacterium]|jgi:hypothetical protein|nr:hypothetical protein [Polyangia bacterium]
MNVVIPPLFFYALGAMLITFGALRAVTFGRRRPERELNEQDNAARAGERRRHLRFGVIWVLMGLFLIASTAGVLKMRSPF